MTYSNAINGVVSGTVVIEYPFDVGGQLKDRWMWMATIDGEVENYNPKKALIAEAEKEGKAWVVLRRHKDGTKSIIERSPIPPTDKSVGILGGRL